MNTMELVLFSTYFSPCTGQDVFHYGAIELDQVLIELFIREKSLAENVDHGLLIA